MTASRPPSTTADASRPTSGRGPNDAPHAPAAPPRFGVADLAVLAAIVALGLIHLPHPFEWDQALFVLGGRVMAHGGMLYRDFWDVKQPGIFAWFAIAGRLFGFRETGIHTFELLWQLGFAITLMVTLRARGTLVSRLAPLFTVGMYYAAVGPWHMTQVEGLSGFPLYLAAWLAADAPEAGAARSRRLFLSGACGAFALLFKLLFLPIVLGFWIAALLAARARRAGPRASTVLPIVLGALVPIAATLAVFAAHGMLPTLVDTWFVYPRRMMGHVRGTRLGTLFDGLTWFGWRFAPVLGLAAVGWSATRRDRLTGPLALWGALGAAVILVQRTSWWQYHWLLLGPPAGVLAAFGAAALWRAQDAGAHTPRAARAGAVLALVALFAGAELALAAKAVELARARFALGAARRAIYQQGVSELYARVLPEAAFLGGTESLPGALLVIGNPIYYVVSNRAPAFAQPGIPLFEDWDASDWETLAANTARTRPAYVMVGPEYAALLLRDRPPATAAFLAVLARDYRPLRSDAEATWFVRAR